jgi:hypothetical protein
MEKYFMDQHLRIGFITDCPPVSPNISGRAMLRVNTQLVRTLSDQITVVFTTSLGGSLEIKDIDEVVRDRCTVLQLPKVIGIISKLAGRVLSKKLGYDNLSFKIRLPVLVKKLYESNTTWLFCSCGADPEALDRAYQLSTASKLPLAIYLVDDFYDGAILSKNQRHLRLAKTIVPDLLKRVDKIFVISDGFKEHLKKTYNVDSIVLPLSFKDSDLKVKPSVSAAKNITFVGSLSHFYIDALIDLATAITNINKKTGLNIVLRLVTPAGSKEAKLLIGDFDCIQCKSAATLNEVQEEVSDSLMCFAPYSFQENSKVMVSTSFPCKMMDYLAASKFILVYGPKYSSSVQYFKEHGLSQVLFEEDLEALQNTIMNQINTPIDYSKTYQKVLRTNHSYVSVSNVIVKSLLKQSN